MDDNNHNWGWEEMVFLLLFYAMSNAKPPVEYQPCCTDQLDDIMQTPKEELEKFMTDIEKRNIAYYEPDPEERDYFSGVGGDPYE